MSKIATYEHIRIVQNLLAKVTRDLLDRQIRHDSSKLESPEVEIFEEFTPKLAKSTYGSDEYKDFLKEMKIALDHHYAVNDHHPEYWANGIKDMNLVCLTELIIDWMAAVQRHENGDIMKSIDMNQQRFGYSDELKQILKNTVNYLEGMK
jgi:hypothetical protein